MKKIKRVLALTASACLFGASALAFTGCAQSDETVVLRVCSWEEYIDLGGWEDDEAIELDDQTIIGVNSMIDDFTEWFNDNHNYKVKVEYSTFGTNEDLYNRLSLGDVYDLVCPSDYMIMKLIAEGNYVEYSDQFWNEDEETNYYATCVSRYIDGADDSIYNVYDWHQKAACYMWGTLGLVYNPEKLVDDGDVSHWNMLLNENYSKQVTIKDNVRDAYFATLGIINNDKLMSESLSASELSKLMNATDDATIALAEDTLKQIKDNVYSFETDSGKADMVTGKVIANEQWSGDAVFIMDQADEEDTELWYSVPEECTNIWFDGWVKLKNGVDWTDEKTEVAEAFVNFLSRPDNAVRNMYYIGYTSAIAGDTVFDYLEWNYGADDEEEINTTPYDVKYFFGNLDGREAIIQADASTFEVNDDGEINRGRQLFAQYPPENVKDRAVVMLDFEDKLADINQMWINVRCLDLLDISPVTVGIVAGVIGLIALAGCLYGFRYKLFIKHKPKKGFEKVDEQ